jgi:hypothetical protein
MCANRWVVVADVGMSVSSTRSDTSGDMEQFELMELILMSEHESKEKAEAETSARRAQKDGWVYLVLSRHEYDAKVGGTEGAR